MSLAPEKSASEFEKSGYAMEQIVLMLLALAAAYFLARVFIEGCTTIDHALMMRKERKKTARH